MSEQAMPNKPNRTEKMDRGPLGFGQCGRCLVEVPFDCGLPLNLLHAHRSNPVMPRVCDAAFAT